ncbi:MAG: bifunctional diguanylate cyclase/phosphodiesterase [Lachnospiraceae bacterium]|nr:bifunctional diguanylate cyclase/phosphodiesterase [Lachnospiraceae bacterium]
MHQFSENLFQNAIDLNDTIVFEYNAVDDVITFSENIKKYIPIPIRIPAFVEKMSYLGKIYDNDIEKAISFFTSVENLDKVRMEYIRFLDFAGEYCWYQLKGRIETDDNEKVTSVYGTLAYVDDETKHQEEEKSLTRDPLTKLLNDDSFTREVANYLDDLPKDVIPNLMIVDLDDFAAWPKIYSEISSDGALIEIGRILKRAFRGSDVIGRIDVDRFAILMKGVRAPNILLERAAYIRQTVKDVWSDFTNNGFITVSIGIAAMHGKEATVERLKARALSALNDAKSGGKDNYVLYTSDMERLDTSVNPILSTKEMEMIRNILDPMSSWAYAVDDNFQLLYRNEVLETRLGNKCEGMCYAQNKGYGEPCNDCPIPKMSSTQTSYDCNVYSPSLRSTIPMRANRITMRNGKSVYLVASVKEDIESQMQALSESEDRTKDSLVRMMDIIWDVNISKNTCIRLKEQNVRSFIDVRIENYRNLIDSFSEAVVYQDDRGKFLEATDPSMIRQNALAGNKMICTELRLKSITDEDVWYGMYTFVLYDPEEEDENGNRPDERIMIVCLNLDDYKKRSLEAVETKIKYRIMHEKSNILKDMALNYERYENVNDMIGILVYEYTVADSSYYLCSNFEDVFEVGKNALTDEWSLISSLKVHVDDREMFDKFLETAKTSAMIQRITARIYNRFGVPVWYTIVLQTLRGLNNTPVRYLGTLQNVNTEMKIKAEMEYRADYDSMTGLYNSETFYKKASAIIRNHPDDKFVIISIDVDRFRLINDRYGIDAGNRTLETVGKMIREVSPKDSIAKRYQGDVFSVLLKYKTDQDLVQYMGKLSEVVRGARVVPISIGLTYGIYKVDDRDLPVRLMCDRARAVKKQVKGNALTNYAVYDDVIRLKLREQAEIEEEMNTALSNKEFVMYLQPQIDIATGKLRGAEALVRWQHPIKGVLVPAQFLSLFESNGFITKMDMYIWELACRYIRDLQDRGIYLPVSVNISRVHIGSTNLSDILLDLVRKYDIAPKYLELEITENLFMEDVDELFNEMASLKKCGFNIMMDDFGSGYSSLNMLRNAPVDTLKIDRFFLDEIISTDRGKIIVEASVRMAKQLGLAVIAEGVETQEQLDFLKTINCDIVQGYYYSRPIPPDEFERFMEKNR